MNVRHKARELALQALFYMDASKNFSQEQIVLFFESMPSPVKIRPFFTKLTEGICAHLPEIDNEISRYAKNWKLERLLNIDRNILRIAIFELLYCDDIPGKVTLNEAIDLAKAFGSKDSPRFINGILDRIYASLTEKKE